MSRKLFLFLAIFLLNLGIFISYRIGYEDGAEEEKERWSDFYHGKEAVSEKTMKLYREENYRIGYKHGMEQCERGGAR